MPIEVASDVEAPTVLSAEEELTQTGEDNASIVDTKESRDEA